MEEEDDEDRDELAGTNSNLCGALKQKMKSVLGTSTYLLYLWLILESHDCLTHPFTVWIQTSHLKKLLEFHL